MVGIVYKVINAQIYFNFFYFTVIKQMAHNIAETHQITKQTKRYITNKTTIDEDFPITNMEELRLMENHLKNDTEYLQQVVTFF